MKCKIALASGIVLLLCIVMLAGCGSVSTEASETTGVISAQQESEPSQKFKSATNYQEGKEYYKAYILYKNSTPPLSFQRCFSTSAVFLSSCNKMH